MSEVCQKVKKLSATDTGHLKYLPINPKADIYLVEVLVVLFAPKFLGLKERITYQADSLTQLLYISAII